MTTSITNPVIGFAGLGAMGGGMAANLVRNGFDVTGFDVYQPLVDKFVHAGGKPARTPRALAEGVDLVVSMVANASQNSALLFDGPDALVHGLGKGKMFILCSTTAPAFALEVRQRLDSEEFKRNDVRFLDCPVSGGTFRAADGTLSIFSSGPDSDLDFAQPVLDCMSANLYRMGGISNGQKTKAIHQLLAATNIISTSEAMGLAARAGLDVSAVVERVNQSEAASFMFSNRTPHMLNNDWSVLSALGIILKDTGIVTDVARAADFPAPLANTAHYSYLAGVRAGLLRDDDAKLVQLYLAPDQADLVHRLANKNTISDHQTPHDSATPSPVEHGITQETIVDLLAGIHLAASIEAMAFCQALDQDRKVMFEIISKAAGWNAIFSDCIPAMLELDRWSLKACGRAHEVEVRLAEAVRKCSSLRFPCPMAAAALQQFYFAAL